MIDDTTSYLSYVILSIHLVKIPARVALNIIF